VLFLLTVAAGCAGESAEGRPWVQTLTFKNVKQVKEYELRGKIALEASSPFWWIPYVPRHYLDPFTLSTERERIEAFYQARGFFDAKVVQAESKRHREDSVDVTITVEEGAPTKIRKVEIVGLEALGKQGTRIKMHFGLARGMVFEHAKYLAERDEIVTRLKSLGYPWAAIEADVLVDREHHVADIHLNVETGPKAKFGTTTVVGATTVDPKLIVRHAAIEPGSNYHPRLLEDARGRIEGLRLFGATSVEVFPREGHPEIADVTVTVHESPFRELRLGLGGGIEPQRMDVHAQAIHTWRNFIGGMRTLQLKVEAGYVALPTFWDIQSSGPAATVETTLTQPDFPFRFSSVSWTVGFDLGIEYGYQFYGPRTQLGWTHSFLHDRVRVGLSYNFQYLGFFGIDPAFTDASTGTFSAGRLFGFVDPYRVGWWQENIALDLRDKPLDPHYGLYLAVVAEEGGDFAGGAFQYEKVLPEARAYLPLGDRIVLAGRVQYGRLFDQGDLGSPITRRFYLGGPGSHRGFNYNRLSAQVPSGIPGNTTAIPIGGDQLFLAQAELRMELFKAGSIGLALVAFLDVGDVAAPTCPTGTCTLPAGSAPAHSSIDFGNLHAATGGGLRVKTPIGTLRFDVGARLNRLDPPNPDAGERMAYHFSIGEAF
jgi:translocation and assembly module TamA